MEIINIKQVVSTLLHKIPELKKVVTDYPSSLEEFPSAIYTTSHVPKFIDDEGNELQTEWTVTIELLSDKGSLTLLENEVLAAFSVIGFNGQSRGANTAFFKRNVIELKAIVDNQTKYVYRN
ncbi:hypothetical protein [Dellaglioa algida]|uniref:Uncharacterized protein n=1 Tax=Dellaglioa algida TaxID=105612 RepID=A0A5C6MBN3_9LACO|nr:hypothetical protein [Dellaglioa algida]MDK1716632.1 hypothetical protein [Dellaglioa algida]MDK1720225.1 hypothetical protein [Dellaglioa algida]MDK1721574.1 hypothetical protein [Dellaglioa algida]MDK1723615.1 hypothetical protein [Dellaglioa algida]TWW10251.1 hypothetical protein LABALGLTS371_15390 [Dellaglioa algida]